MCTLGLLQSDKGGYLDGGKNNASQIFSDWNTVRDKLDKIFDNSYCHSVGNLAKRFDGVNLTEAKAEMV